MKLFSALAAAAIAVTGALAPAAEAHHLGYRHEYNAASWTHLAETIEDHGVQIWLDAKYCEENGLLGMAIKGQDGSMHMLICRDNHNDNYNEMADTFRHEVVHLIQYCKGERNGATIATLYPDQAEESLRIARDYLHMPMGAYDKEKWINEAEARVMAFVLDEREIARQFADQCSHRRGSRS